MSEPTKGPWSLLPEEVDKSYIRIRGTRLGGRYKVANVLTPAYEGAHEREAQETRANARLIAAAPELLDAAEALMASARVGVLNDPDAFGRAVRMSREAIAKATGAAP